jgi:hypothetical protein
VLCVINHIARFCYVFEKRNPHIRVPAAFRNMLGMIGLCKKENSAFQNGYPANLANGLGRGDGFLRMGFARILRLMFLMIFSLTGSAR